MTEDELKAIEHYWNHESSSDTNDDYTWLNETIPALIAEVRRLNQLVVDHHVIDRNALAGDTCKHCARAKRMKA
jgi:hypothetical protein